MSAQWAIIALVAHRFQNLVHLALLMTSQVEVTSLTASHAPLGSSVDNQDSPPLLDHALVAGIALSAHPPLNQATHLLVGAVNQDSIVQMAHCLNYPVPLATTATALGLVKCLVHAMLAISAVWEQTHPLLPMDLQVTFAHADTSASWLLTGLNHALKDYTPTSLETQLPATAHLAELGGIVKVKVCVHQQGHVQLVISAHLVKVHLSQMNMFVSLDTAAPRVVYYQCLAPQDAIRTCWDNPHVSPAPQATTV